MEYPVYSHGYGRYIAVTSILVVENSGCSLAWSVRHWAHMANDRIKLGVLWKHEGRDGKKPFLSGAVRNEGLESAIALLRDGGRLLVLSNVTKRPDKKDPDCELFVVPDKPLKGG